MKRPRLATGSFTPPDRQPAGVADGILQRLSNGRGDSYRNLRLPDRLTPPAGVVGFRNSSRHASRRCAPGRLFFLARQTRNGRLRASLKGAYAHVGLTRPNIARVNWLARSGLRFEGLSFHPDPTANRRRTRPLGPRVVRDALQPLHKPRERRAPQRLTLLPFQPLRKLLLRKLPSRFGLGPGYVGL
jgi:hypothetical protein